MVDERISSVDVFWNFGGATGLPDSHQFRVESGKIRYLHTIMIMSKWCGLLEGIKQLCGRGILDIDFRVYIFQQF